MVCYRQQLTIWSGKLILCKKHLIFAYFGVHCVPDFGRTWTPNRWQRPMSGVHLCIRKFSTGKFFGAATHGILMHSGFRKCSRFWWPSLRFEVTAAQSEVIGQKPEVLQKVRGVTDQSHSANFGPITLKLIEHVVPISHVLFILKR